MPKAGNGGLGPLLAERLGIPTALIGGAVFLRSNWGVEAAQATGVEWLAAVFHNSAAVLLTLALALLGVDLVQAVAARHVDGTPSKLVRQLIAVVVWAAALGILGAIVFDVPLGSVVTTSGLMVAVVGIALKNMISDLFAGLSVSVKIGDWIEIDGHLGRVVEVSWSATRLVTRNHVSVTIPNTHLMSKPFRNYSRPEPWYLEELRVVLSQSVPLAQAERILLAAATQVGVLTGLTMPPSLRVRAVEGGTVEWGVRFYAPDAGSASELRYQVYRYILEHLRNAGIEPARDLLEIHRPDPILPGGKDTAFLRGVDLFACLTDEELMTLAASAQQRLLTIGTPVVRQGEAGSSLFLLKEGLLEVRILGGDGLETPVGQIAPGHFFGEMSLLTGAPRSATVAPQVDSLVYEITRDELEPFLQRRPELARHMSEVLAERQVRNGPKLEANRQDIADAAKHSLTDQLLARISSFFGLYSTV